ncbi:MAG: HesA/MoeB/ThiF family protein [Bacteroidia bacterium]|nr:HesA/MoeB/ThiF family protein [Bacteroidia bacterium]
MTKERTDSFMSRRYSAQTRLPVWNQRALSEATALVIGVGGLGSPAALYLAAMGIGRLILADPDSIAEENLHRQPLYTPDAIGASKVKVLSAYLLRLRPDLRVESIERWVDESLLHDIGPKAQIWIDGTDNLHSRLVIDAVASALKKPWVYGAVFQEEGQVALLEGIRYRSLFGEGTEGPSCSEAGVIGALPGIIGSWQATLAAQYLASPEVVPKNRLFRVDLRRGETHSFLLATELREPATLEISMEEAQSLSDAHWVSLCELHGANMPFPHDKKAWYDWDRWTLPARPVILVCEEGNRSRQIAYALRRKTGRSNIYSLRGGLRSLSPSHLTQ